MDFALTKTQRDIEESAGWVCARFDDDYWAGLDARRWSSAPWKLP